MKILEQLNEIIEQIKSLVKEDETADYTDFKLAGERLLQSLPRIKNEKDIVIDVILKYFDMTMDELNSRCRRIEYVFPRQCVHNFVKKYTKLSLQSIADITGQEHATVLHSIKAIDEYLETNKEKRAIIQYLEYKILLELGKDPQKEIDKPIKKEKCYTNTKKVFQNIPSVNASMHILPKFIPESKFACYATL